MKGENVMLAVKDLEVYYGSIHAIKKISFEVREGEIVTLIGANGAGKTTTLHAISGLVKARSGEINFCGNNLRSMEAHKIIRLGLAQVPEGRRIFASMTVQENLEMGAYIRRDREQIQQDYERVFERLPRLKERRRQIAGTLSGGEQQMLAIGRALMSNPKMLLLDEPSMGLSPLLVSEIFKIIRDVNESGMTVLLVEQNAKQALEIADRAYVLETGTISMSGDASELATDEKVRAAYLGGAQ
nr:ABC transporter ATP-binding protein [Anaeromassilibacillus sp. An200]